MDELGFIEYRPRIGDGGKPLRGCYKPAKNELGIPTKTPTKLAEVVGLGKFTIKDFPQEQQAEIVPFPKGDADLPEHIKKRTKERTDK
jgi:hypothetical protein